MSAPKLETFDSSWSAVGIPLFVVVMLSGMLWLMSI
jgi:hypothetical protein